MGRAPIKNTCPDINSAQADIKNIISSLEDLYEGTLEELRESNSTLREYGEQQEDRADALEDELEDLRVELSEMTSDHDYYKEQLAAIEAAQ